MKARLLRGLTGISGHPRAVSSRTHLQVLSTLPSTKALQNEVCLCFHPPDTGSQPPGAQCVATE